jgi:putative addiction module CopG family antidote
MPTGRQQLVVTLPAEMVELVQRKVASGEYADESDVISDGLTFLEDEEQRLERWLREEVVSACREFDEDPFSAVSSVEFRLELEQARKVKPLP